MHRPPPVLKLPDQTSLLQAQQSALGMATELNSLALTYALDLNKSWLELMQKQVMKFAGFPQRLSECQTPQEVFLLQAGIAGNAAQDLKEGLAAQAGVIIRVTQDYKDGLDRLAQIGEDMAKRADQALEKGAEAAHAMTKQASDAIEKGRQTAQAIMDQAGQIVEQQFEAAQLPAKTTDSGNTPNAGSGH